MENIREEKMKLNGTAALTTLFLIMLATVAWAALPQTINYQGYLRNTNGTPVSSQVTVVFSLYTTSSAGTALWTESRNITPANGIYSHQLGSVTPFPAGLFANDTLWLGIKIGSDPEMTPRELLTSTPFAFRSGTADSVGSAALAALDSRYIDPTETHATSQQIATLRWDQVTGGAGPYAVGTNPRALAFDGTNIWVANYGDGTVQKVNPATGAAGSPITVGTNPYALAFDGANVWVANYGSNSVQKINPTTGAAGSAITVGTNPSALVFDGANIWVALQGTANSVRKIDPATGTLSAPITVGTNPSALAFDGTSIWVANSGSASVTRITPGETTYVNTFTVGEGPGSLTFDGTSIWVANSTGNSLMRLDPTSGAVQATYTTLMSGPRALAFDGRYLWLANYGGDSVVKVDTAAGPLSPAIHVSGSPTALTFDGANLWTANYSGNSVARLAGVAIAAGPLTVSGTSLNSGAVSTAQLADSSVTNLKMAANSVSASNIQSNAVTGAKVAAGAITADKMGFYGKIAIVAQSGGNYNNPATAMGAFASWCGTPSASNPCLMKIMPGVYNIGTGSVNMQPYIDIEGSGENVTVIQGNKDGAIINGANNSELRFLTVRHTGGTTTAMAIYNINASPRITNVTAIVSGATDWSYCIENSGASPVMSNVTITASASGSAWSVGISNISSSAPLISNVFMNVSGSSTHVFGFHNTASSPTIRNSIINITAPAGAGIGVASYPSGTVTISESAIQGAMNSTINSQEGVTTLVANTQLNGGMVSGTGVFHCVGAYNGSFTALGTNCR
jgi:YVTN family beta-propeller protein